MRITNESYKKKHYDNEDLEECAKLHTINYVKMQEIFMILTRLQFINIKYSLFFI